MRTIPFLHKTLCVLLALCLCCFPLAGCANNSVKQDQPLLRQIAAAVTASQNILSEVMESAGKLSGKTTVAYEESQQSTDFDAIQNYVETCRTASTALAASTEALTAQAQTIDSAAGAKSEVAQTLLAAQKEYFTDALSLFQNMQETLDFYVQQYEAMQPLIQSLSTQASDEQSYLVAVYQAAGEVRSALAALPTPAWLSELWPCYVSSLDMLIKYMESRSWGLAYADVLRLYSANQLISRMGLVAGQYEDTIFDLLSREYNHISFLLETNLMALGKEILASCESASLAKESYLSQAPIVFSRYTLAKEIFPNLYPSMDSAVNLLLYTDKSVCNVLVTAEIAGFTQKYEQKLTLTSEMTYLMIKPPVLADMPDLSAAKDTQLTLRVENIDTGEILVQESQPLQLYSIYDYKNYSDEFGIIQNDNILAWVTPESEGVLQVRREAISWLEETLGSSYGILPGYQLAYGFRSGQEAYVTYYEVAAIQSAITRLGVRYNMGPYSFNASQRVLTPDAVLQSKSGICIETAVLMASVLQSAGMHAMIVFTPGHAQTAVETWSGSGEYFLIETTLLPFGATEAELNTLIQPLSAQDWANYLANAAEKAQQSGGMVYVVDCDLATVLDIQGLAY